MGTFQTKNRLLSIADGPAAEVINPNGSAQIVIVCEHASNFIPASLSGLGLTDAEMLSHAAWDPGALAVARHISGVLDAPLVASRVSRLVYDCNRPPSSPDAMTTKSELIDVPGNQNLSSEMQTMRINEIYDPFRTLLNATRENSAGGNPAIVTIHSFTPTYFGAARSVELGLLHDDDERLARQMLDVAPSHTLMRTELNEPYGPADGVTHTLVEHALPVGLLNVMIEIRNDLVQTAPDITRVADELSKMIEQGLHACNHAMRRSSGLGN